MLLSLVTSLILSRLDYSSATLVGVPAYLIDRLQSILHAAARLVNGSRKYDHLHGVADDDSRRRLRSATTHQLMVPRMRLRTVGDRAFGTAGARVWNDLPSSVVSAPSLAVFKKNLKTHFFGSPTVTDVNAF